MPPVLHESLDCYFKGKNRVEELTSTLFDLRNIFASLILLRGAKPKVVSEKPKGRHKLE